MTRAQEKRKAIEDQGPPGDISSSQKYLISPQRGETASCPPLHSDNKDLRSINDHLKYFQTSSNHLIQKKKGYVTYVNDGKNLGLQRKSPSGNITFDVKTIHIRTQQMLSCQTLVNWTTPSWRVTMKTWSWTTKEPRMSLENKNDKRLGSWISRLARLSAPDVLMGFSKSTRIKIHEFSTAKEELRTLARDGKYNIGGERTCGRRRPHVSTQEANY